MLTTATILVNLVIRLRAAIGTHLDREARASRPVWIGTRLYAPAPPPAHQSKLAREVWALLWHRLASLSRRWEALHAKWRENRLPKPRPARPATTTAPARPIVRLPRAFAWLNRRIPESAPPTGLLLVLPRDPETQAFVQAAPQAGRLLRPLCQALGIRQPDWLRLPPRPRRPRPKRPPSPRAPSQAALLAAIPKDRALQPYVLAATRAWKKSGE